LKSSKAVTILNAIILDLPWASILGDAYKQFRRLLRGFSQEGVYEVLDYHATLELLDVSGNNAHYTKRKKIRYLQDDIIAYQDHAWGDGKILQNFQCSPGRAVDQYRAGFKTFVLISLRQIKSRGDVDEFNIEWDVENGFLKSDGWWGTDITQRTKQISVNVIFPHKRKPYHVILEESNRRKTHYLSKDSFKSLPDGRVKVGFKISKPRLYEHYLLKWRW
jgi:hypothetical protein